MAYPAAQLINRSWYLSGIIARDLETVPGNYATEGLFLLNTLLDFKASDLRLIPYWNRYQFNMVTGQELYFIQNLYAVETMTFNIGDVRYPLTQVVSRDQYFGSGRVDNINSLPFIYHVERTKGGSNIYVYYRPEENYISNLSGKFALTDVTLFQDMSLVYDPFYLEYLRYALAEMMCMESDISLDEDKRRMLSKYEKKLLDTSPPDLSMQKIGLLQTNVGLNWAQINVGKGWSP